MEDYHLVLCHNLSMPKRLPLTPDMAEKALLVGNRIRALREQKGYTQASLATKVGITSGAIGQYETGRNLPKVRTLERLAGVLEVTTNWLMNGEDEKEALRAHTSAEREALLTIREIPAELHDAALAMLKGLTAKKKPP